MLRNAAIAIIAIMIIEVAAIAAGQNGLMFLTAIGLISGLGGYVVVEDFRAGLFDRLFERFRK